MRALLSTIHAANGNRRGASRAMKFRLLPPESAPVSTESATKMFGGGDDLITDEAIKARQRELGLV